MLHKAIVYCTENVKVIITFKKQECNMPYQITICLKRFSLFLLFSSRVMLTRKVLGNQQKRGGENALLVST